MHSTFATTPKAFQYGRVRFCAVVRKPRAFFLPKIPDRIAFPSRRQAVRHGRKMLGATVVNDVMDPFSTVRVFRNGTLVAVIIARDKKQNVFRYALRSSDSNGLHRPVFVYNARPTNNINCIRPYNENIYDRTTCYRGISYRLDFGQ